jgi:hypothetical protein
MTLLPYVDDGGMDPLGTLALFAMVEMIRFDDVVVLCFCCDVCFCVVVKERLAFRVRLLSGGNSTWHVINVVA